VPESYASFLTEKPQPPTSSSVNVHAARGTFPLKVTFGVLARRGSLQITREGNTSPNGPPSESQPTGVNGRPRCVLEEDVTTKVGPRMVEIRGLDASTEGEFARSEHERLSFCDSRWQPSVAVQVEWDQHLGLLYLN
jgi:hypothetical protein